jgi:hypothetical protein
MDQHQHGNSELNAEAFELTKKTLQCININFRLPNLDRQSRQKTPKKTNKRKYREIWCVVRCHVAGKFSDGDALLDVPDPDAGQVAALPSHQVPPVLRPEQKKNQSMRIAINQAINKWFSQSVG